MIANASDRVENAIAGPVFLKPETNNIITAKNPAGVLPTITAQKTDAISGTTVRGTGTSRVRQSKTAHTTNHTETAAITDVRRFDGIYLVSLGVMV